MDSIFKGRRKFIQIFALGSKFRERCTTTTLTADSVSALVKFVATALGVTAQCETKTKHVDLLVKINHNISLLDFIGTFNKSRRAQNERRFG